MVASNVAYPHPGTLTGAFGSFDMTQDIVLGSRGDLNEQRHFMGEMAGLMISDTDLTSAQVQCIFTMSEEFLPTQLAACETSQTDAQSSVLSVSFLGSSVDESGHGNSVSWAGEADVTFSGALFDGDMDYVTVSDFTYETGNGEFTVAFWMTKEDCTDGVYEYLYSHMSSTDSSTMWSMSGLNIYLGCEQAGGGQSSLGGAVIRYSLVDTSAQEAMFDTPLHDAGDFDAVTHVWVHVVLAVTPTSVRTYDDGYLFPHQPEDEYGFYTGNGANDANLADPDPGSLNGGGLGAMDFALDLVLGGRADHDRDRHFLGKMALVNVFDSTLSGSQAQCLFRGGDAALPDPNAVYEASSCAPLVLDVSFIGDSFDRSGSGASVNLQGGGDCGFGGSALWRLRRVRDDRGYCVRGGRRYIHDLILDDEGGLHWWHL